MSMDRGSPVWLGGFGKAKEQATLEARRAADEAADLIDHYRSLLREAGEAFEYIHNQTFPGCRGIDAISRDMMFANDRARLMVSRINEALGGG